MSSISICRLNLFGITGTAAMGLPVDIEQLKDRLNLFGITGTAAPGMV